jgi:FlaA1/EpsC-like NDP-sugar epimerase
MEIKDINSWAQSVLVWLLDLPRGQKRAIQVVADLVTLSLCFLLALVLRLESLGAALRPDPWVVFFVTLPVTIGVFVRVGFYRAVVRYISARAFRVIAIGVLASAVTMFAISQISGLWLPRSVPLIYALVALIAVGAIRFVMRAIYRTRIGGPLPNVLIYGAGASGRQLFHSLHHSHEYRPVGFVDDNPALRGAVIGGLSVHAPDRIGELIEEREVEVVLLAMPSVSRARRAAIIEFLEPFPVRVQTVPGMVDLISGSAAVDEIRAVSIEDILGRDPVAPRLDLMQAHIRGRTVFVSGAGGSIGSELCRQIVRNGPARLILFELSEYALYRVDQELRATPEASQVEIIPLIGSVQDGARAEWLMKHFGVDTVFHAAAYKHVPLVEQNMIEGVRNNVFGTLALAEAASRAGVGSFTLISTDKAVRPTNVMGASKRMAELVCQALGREDNATLFSMVRFGNVLGSSGSVIPLFSEQIERGGPVTVTHPDITRYFMTIPEAAQLVIQASALARGGDVFLLDMGEPVRIADLAARMIRLAGRKPVFDPQDASEPDAGKVEIRFTQLRPGEKLYEELFIGTDTSGTSHPRILTSLETSLSRRDLALHLDAIKSACTDNDLARLRRALAEAPTLYTPGSKIVDESGLDDSAVQTIQVA